MSISDKTLVRQGKAQRSVNDLKIGERVAVQCDQSAPAKTADSIRILQAPKRG